MLKISNMDDLLDTQNHPKIIYDLKRLMHYRTMYEYYFKLRVKWLRGGRNIDIEHLMLKMHNYGQKYNDLYKKICNYFVSNSFELAEMYFDRVFVSYENNNVLKKKIRGWKKYRSTFSKRPI